jgi:Xaa-Pro aminopeptidase
MTDMEKPCRNIPWQSDGLQGPGHHPHLCLGHAHPAAAQTGTACSVVDAAARQVFTDAGYRPDCQVPGLPHSTGHSLGLDIHETPSIVAGNDTCLADGLCSLIEPIFRISAECCVPLECIVFMTQTGLRWFAPLPCRRMIHPEIAPPEPLFRECP